MKNYIVYMHTSPNGKKYIGITSMKFNKRCNAGYKNNEHFCNAIKKYGWNNIKHEILYENLTKEEAEQKEIELIVFYKSNNREYGYNIANGGHINCVSKETKNKISKNNAKYWKNKHLNKKTREKISQSRKGHVVNEETIKKIKYTRQKKYPNGFHHTKEAKIKMCINKSKPVICLETKIIYYGAKEASKKTNINAGTIGLCCKRKRKTAGKFHWAYYKEQ